MSSFNDVVQPGVDVLQVTLRASSSLQRSRQPPSGGTAQPTEGVHFGSSLSRSLAPSLSLSLSLVFLSNK